MGREGVVSTFKMLWERLEGPYYRILGCTMLLCLSFCPISPSCRWCGYSTRVEAGARSPKDRRGWSQVHRCSIRETQEGVMASHNYSSPVSQLGAMALYLYFQGLEWGHTGGTNGQLIEHGEPRGSLVCLTSPKCLLLHMPHVYSASHEYSVSAQLLPPFLCLHTCFPSSASNSSLKPSASTLSLMYPHLLASLIFESKSNILK